MTETVARPVEQRMKRWQEQRWILDAFIGAAGMDFAMNFGGYMMYPCGLDAAPDFNRVRQRVKKFTDIHREYAAAARRREGLANAAVEEGHFVTAREHAFTASLLWGAAQWTIYENDERTIEYHERKARCYEQFIKYAPHPVRRVEIPFGSTTLPAHLHLPRGATGPVPCVLSLSGMDSFKETVVPIYGDKYLERGIARLAYDGPGQGECCVRGTWVTATNHIDAGRAVLDWAKAQPEIDPNRIVLAGNSFGSFWGTQIAAEVPGLLAVSVAAVCHEPGAHTIFNMAAPTFKLRFMYMAGYDDEAEFDAFMKTMTLEGYPEKITCPFMVLAGEDDELSPIEHTYRLFDKVRAPKTLYVYQGETHGVGGGPAGQFGPNRVGTISQWLADRIAGRPMRSERIFVDVTGATHVTPLD